VAEAIELVVTELSDSRETADVPKRLRDSGVVELAVPEQRAAVAVDAVRLPTNSFSPSTWFDDIAERMASRSPANAARTYRSNRAGSSRIFVSYVAIALPTFANGRSTDWFASGPNTDSCRCPRPERLRPEAVLPPVPEEPCLVCGTDDGHRPTRRETNSLCQPPAVQITVLTSLPPLRGVS
jgi:hypothetical protein